MSIPSLNHALNQYYVKGEGPHPLELANRALEIIKEKGLDAFQETTFEEMYGSNLGLNSPENCARCSAFVGNVRAIFTSIYFTHYVCWVLDNTQVPARMRGGIINGPAAAIPALIAKYYKADNRPPLASTVIVRVTNGFAMPMTMTPLADRYLRLLSHHVEKAGLPLSITVGEGIVGGQTYPEVLRVESISPEMEYGGFNPILIPELIECLDQVGQSLVSLSRFAHADSIEGENS